MNPQFHASAFAEAVSDQRKLADQSLREAAETIGEVSPSTLSRVERGLEAEVGTLLRICSWLGRPLTDFIGNSPKPLPEALAQHIKELRRVALVRKAEAQQATQEARDIEQRIDFALRTYEADGEGAALSYLKYGASK